jgi:hypothetical protein
MPHDNAMRGFGLKIAGYAENPDQSTDRTPTKQKAAGKLPHRPSSSARGTFRSHRAVLIEMN